MSIFGYKERRKYWALFFVFTAFIISPSIKTTVVPVDEILLFDFGTGTNFINVGNLASLFLIIIATLFWRNKA